METAGNQQQETTRVINYQELDVETAEAGSVRAAIMTAPNLVRLHKLLEAAAERDDADELLSEELMEKLPHWGAEPPNKPDGIFSWDHTAQLGFNDDPMVGFYLEPRQDFEDAKTEEAEAVWEMLSEARNLDNLLTILLGTWEREDAGSRFFPEEMEHLPKFGGEKPEEPKGFLLISWDESRMLVHDDEPRNERSYLLLSR